MEGSDEALMRRALVLAEKGLYTARPNPYVGCVIARNGKVIAEGWHEFRGEQHAETAAIGQLGNARPEGLNIYVNMEPCSHHGHTPPCVEAIVNLGPERVVVAMEDPNPKVNGKGIGILRKAGIRVDVGVCREQAEWLNRGHSKRMVSGRPWVTLKMASTLDGMTALKTGLSQWITSEEARMDAQLLRAASCAIVTGIGTALQDNPRLTVRGIEIPRQPLKVLIDSNMRHSHDMELFKTGRTLVATACNAIKEDFDSDDVLMASFPDGKGRVNLGSLLAHLGSRECNHVLVEAGARLNGAFLEDRWVDELVLYTAPSVFGIGRSLFEIVPPASPGNAFRFSLQKVDRIGDDVKAVYVTE